MIFRVLMVAYNLRGLLFSLALKYKLTGIFHSQDLFKHDESEAQGANPKCDENEN